jgi:hypothetical protein
MRSVVVLASAALPSVAEIVVAPLVSANNAPPSTAPAPAATSGLTGTGSSAPAFSDSPLPERAPPIPGSEEYFFIKFGRAFQKILLKEILYFEGEKEYVRVVTPGPQVARLPAVQGY